MLGCDIWSGAYKAVFTKKRCEENAKAEGVANVRLIDTTDGCFMAGRKRPCWALVAPHCWWERSKVRICITSRKTPFRRP